MLCFEVSVNGERICRAGAADLQVLSTQLSWARRTKDGKEEEFLSLTSSGMNTGVKHVKWNGRDEIQVGDEIVIRVTETSAADVPKESDLFTAEMQKTITEMVSKLATQTAKEE